ncbi:hypothetical protein F5Y16DRAFT_400435 [Xylariaceae sp. FL0255]|nr:hypothetical protein F5Y16DRAFT_400435 [Xylariaceae sp. FL0255]
MPSDFAYQQQVPINGHVVRMAPPGSETNLYFIPVGNLPFHTSWQQLKDHVRTNACPVERVEVHDATTGHVVVRGRENFEAALSMVVQKTVSHAEKSAKLVPDLLNGGVFNNRALIAEGKNRDQCVWIKERVDGHPSSPESSKSSRYTASPSQPAMLIQMAPISAAYNDPASTSAASYVMSPTMAATSYLQTPSMVSEYQDSAGSYGMMNSLSINDVAPAAYSYTPSFPQPDTTSNYHSNGYSMGYNAGENEHTANSASTKKREVGIRRLQPWTTYQQVLDLIRQQAGSVADQLEYLEVPPADSQDGSNRGYALATLKTELAAEKLIKRLNNVKYDGRTLEVKYARNGHTGSSSSHRSRTNESEPHRSHHSGSTRRDRRENRNGRSESNNQRTQPTDEVVIAHGSSSSSNYRYEGGESSRRH